MIDLHCHMLPGIDDGPRNIDEALNMARMAAEDGITDVIVTPHMQNGLYHNNAEKVLSEVSMFQRTLVQEGISLQIHPGAEVHIHPTLMENLYNHKLLTLCNADKYLLIELPVLTIPDYTTALLRELIIEGIVPIIVHPERNIYLMKGSRLLAGLIDLGAIIQINAGSLLGQRGKQIQRFAKELLKNRMVHVIASDGHNGTTRRPLLTDAYRAAADVVSDVDVGQLQENAKSILMGKPCKVNNPLIRRKHERFRWFF